MKETEFVTVVAVYENVSLAEWAVTQVKERGAASDWIVLGRRSDGPEQGVGRDVVSTDYLGKQAAAEPEDGEAENHWSAGAAVGATLGGTAGLLAATYVIPGLGTLTAAQPLVTTLLGAGLGSFLGTWWQESTAPPADHQRQLDSTRIGGVLVACVTDSQRVDACRAALAVAGPVEIRVHPGGPTSVAGP